MKKMTIAILASAAALLMAACSQSAGDKPEETAQPTAEEMNAADPADSEAVDMFAAPECVIEAPPETVCSADVNACGHPSVCDCPSGYEYSPALGKCLVDVFGVEGDATFIPLEENECVAVATGVCTRDINACGQPSTCGCDEGFVWNASAGKCLKDLNQ
ncbi:MAG: hypothetical protein H6848_08595 [Caulobacterales bacterium]|nr:hypothetical protein [Caulobacterales bacterium]